MRYSGWKIWLIVGLGLIAIVGAHLLPHAVRDTGDWSVVGIGFGVLMALGCLLFGLSAFVMDDIQRQNLKADWYWGSVAGLSLLCGLALPSVLFTTGLSHIVEIMHMRETPKGYFFAGVMITLACILAGWVLAWIYRRLRWMK
jgi:hypothetical protein